MNNILKIINGRIIDPANNVDTVSDLHVVDGKIVSKLTNEQEKQAQVIDANNCIVSPGFVDIHVHFREPGQTHKETIKTGAQAAASGGFTTVVCMPNTTPALDSVDIIESVTKIIERDACINVYLSGCLTKDRAGKLLTEAQYLKKAGVVALTDDGSCIQDATVMKYACEKANKYGLVVMDHCQDEALTENAVMHEGVISLRLGLKGWPAEAEDCIVARNIDISKETGAHIHMQHISSGNAISLIREAKKKGIRVTAEATPHHLALTDDCLSTYDTNFKMNPPLRTEKDRLALIEGLLDGTIDIIATDHAPHTSAEKECEFQLAPFGLIGLETCLSVCLETLYHTKLCDMNFLVSRLTHKPAEIISSNAGTLSIGAIADITIFDPTATRHFSKNSFKSYSSNSPWIDKTLRGLIKYTIVEGSIVYQNN